MEAHLHTIMVVLVLGVVVLASQTCHGRSDTTMRIYESKQAVTSFRVKDKNTTPPAPLFSSSPHFKSPPPQQNHCPPPPAMY
ncbi:hypothetical protein CsSME_00027855 [Camellia sinensis var. sinensis]